MITSHKKLLLIGAGGYAKSVIDSLPHGQYDICGFIDKYKNKKLPMHLGHPILGVSLDEIDDLYQYCYFICIGNNEDRKYYYDFLKRNKCKLINVVDPTAVVSSNTKIGEGVFIGKMVIVNSDVIVEDNTILNTRSLVEHGCRIRKHVNLSTNAVINGDVFVEEGAFIGSCSVVNGQIRVGQWSTIGAGAVVVKDVNEYTTVVGVPAKPIVRRMLDGTDIYCG